ncbi:ribosomal RNA-processing protein 8 [Galleria mellonella]|uniref:Ribosomal RNA-processing protein 8 n=1 Tax=Galleria mellonella TaxID=7137 RepID=A0A6J1WU73_GALME|nr:ribosomal RNA-processing protein 8 [Galleria mellonella]
MFKIPKWEEDVPKTNINFGSVVKKKKGKDFDKPQLENSPDKPVEQNSNKIISKKNKQRNVFSVTNIEMQKSSNNKNKGNAILNKNNSQAGNNLNASIQNPRSDEILPNSNKRKHNEIVGNDDSAQPPVSKKKRRKKKNKHDLHTIHDNNDAVDASNVAAKLKKLETNFKESISTKSKSKLNEPKTKFKSVNGNIQQKESTTVSNENVTNVEHKRSKKRKKRNKSDSDNFSEPKDESQINLKSMNDTSNTVSNSFTNGQVTNRIKLNSKKEKLKKILALNNNRKEIDVTNKGSQLRQRMLEKLKAAQFRYLNEKLYTSSGSEAKQLFQNDPDAFQTYHQGYQLQVKKWPVNPLDVIVTRILKMPKSYTIADMGCGEAALSKRVPQSVRSFDLVASADGVEACDMAHTPLLAGSTDVAVYCLALMGTDLTQYLVEANRVLKMGGHLLIAEVESRFDKVDDFTSEVQKLGFKLKKLDSSHKVFFFMEFIKIREPPVKKSKLPAISLKPCLYKRR